MAENTNTKMKLISNAELMLYPGHCIVMPAAQENTS
jgi:hypothetical protein